MMILNRFSRHDRILVPTNGKFGERVAKIGSRYCNVEHLQGLWGEPIDQALIEGRLSTGEIDGMMVCHNETSTGVMQDVNSLAKIATAYDVPFLLDSITSVGGIPTKLAEWGIEAAAIGAQKCTAGPSGLAALAVSQSYVSKVRERRELGVPCAFYLDILPALEKSEDDQTPWTAAVNLVFGWRQALRELADEGLSNREQRCRSLAAGVRKLLMHAGLTPYGHESIWSDTVVAVELPSGLDDHFRAHLATDHGVHVIGGQDNLKHRIFRIGCMGLTTPAEMAEGCTRLFRALRNEGAALTRNIENMICESDFN